MNVDNILRFLDCLGAQQISPEGEWVKCSCPLAPWRHAKGTDSSPSFGIRIDDTNNSYWNCWTCGGGENLEGLVGLLRKQGAGQLPYMELGAAMDVVKVENVTINLDIKPFNYIPPEEVIVEFEEQWLRSFQQASTHPKAFKYLVSRGLSLETIERFDIRYDSNKGTVCFPLKDRMGKCVGFHGRFITPWTTDKGNVVRYHSYDFKGIRNNSVWLGENFLREEIPVVIVEGMFDAAAVWPVYPNVVSPLVSGMNAAKIDRMHNKFGKIITFFDHGGAGDKARNKINSKFSGQVIGEIIPEVDKDPGDCSAEQIKSLLDRIMH